METFFTAAALMSPTITNAQVLLVLPYSGHYVWPEQPGLAFYQVTRELIPFARPAAAPGWIAP